MDIGIKGTVDLSTGFFTAASDREEQRLLALEALHVVPHTNDQRFSLMRDKNGAINIVPFFGDLDSQQTVIAEKENNAGNWGLTTPRVSP